MPAVKAYFDPKTRDSLLQEAIKKTRGKGEFPFAFGLGKSGALLAIDYRDEHGPDKLLKEIKKSQYKDKFVVGTAAINGKVIEMTAIHKKNKIKPIEVKDYLKELQSPLSRAILDGHSDDDNGASDAAIQAEPATIDATTDGAAAEKEQLIASVDKAIEELDEIISSL
jgi:hypothetical protein